ncbi:biliverdin-producing heme oxygenase [Chryseobacterium paridis]|uniref:Biliverdin-producing heme oxygenase n=1 Tax=Chryseobacterium paridis TaxID=2800328 RepID=A0ABS1FYU5_9FLAO|nr:biliverdin-producing heme oxygenase [Chryseobacterium paridis]MBK1897625.1 biliverdin-producing heme oxygenase [Chryseobacterium paridis]
MVSEYLKQNTAEYHDAAEKLFNSEKIFNKTFTLDDYKKIINTNYLMLLHSEDKIFNSLNGNFAEKLQLDQRKKLPLIEKDLASLALKNQAATHTLEVNNEHEALGMMYVIEGSTLGGNVIAKQLSKTEGFDEITFNFFGCYQENTGPMWKNFKEVLDTEVAEDNYNEVLSGAKKLYTFLLNVN